VTVCELPLVTPLRQTQKNRLPDVDSQIPKELTHITDSQRYRFRSQFSSSKHVLLIEPMPWSFVHSVSLYLPSSGQCVCPRRAVVFARVVPLSLPHFVLCQLEKSCSVRRWSGLSGPSSGLERRKVSVSLVMDSGRRSHPPTPKSPASIPTRGLLP
jgi:hypothetical protein